MLHGEFVPPKPRPDRAHPRINAMSEPEIERNVQLFANLCMMTAVPRITEKTFDEFMWRVRFLERCQILTEGVVTREYALAHVGMETNATKRSRYAFIKSVVRHVDDQIVKSLRVERARDIADR